MVIDLGFDATEIADRKNYTAFVGTWSHPRGKGITHGGAGSYGVLLAGGGNILRLWGAGISTYDDALRAFGVRAAVEALPKGAILTARIKGLTDHVSYPDGHARRALRNGGFKADGKTPYDAIDVMEDLIVAMNAGILSLARLGKRDVPYGLLLAEALASKEAKKAANAYAMLSTQSDRNEIFATQAEPDPHGLMLL